MRRMIVSAISAVMRARMMRLLGLMALLGLLSACSAPTKEEVAADRQTNASFRRYLGDVYGRLQDQWEIHLAKSPKDQGCGSLRVSFSLSPTGKVEHVHVQNNKDTDPALTKSVVKVIQDTNFPPMPAELVQRVKKVDGGGLGFGITFNMDKPTSGGSLMSVEEKKQMEKWWGSGRSGLDQVSVRLTANEESGARQAQNQPPASPTAKGGSASGGKTTTVKLTQTPKERYCRLVTQAVEKKWNKYSMLELAGITYGRLDVVFYVNKKGGVEDVQVVNDAQSYRALTLFTLRAIKDAEIPSMPANVIPLLSKKDRERLKIQYNVLIY